MMNDPYYYDKKSVRCSVCNKDVIWNGCEKTLKAHINSNNHTMLLRKESISHKRSRSIAVKGVEFVSKYAKPVAKFFENFTAVESATKFLLNRKKSIAIVRFFSPEIVQWILNIQSSWLIEGQHAVLKPDTFTGNRPPKKAGIEGDGDLHFPPVPKIHNDEWADQLQGSSYVHSSKYNEHPSNNLTVYGGFKSSEMKDTGSNYGILSKNVSQYQEQDMVEDTKNKLSNKYRKIYFDDMQQDVQPNENYIQNTQSFSNDQTNFYEHVNYSNSSQPKENYYSREDEERKQRDDSFKKYPQEKEERRVQDDSYKKWVPDIEYTHQHSRKNIYPEQRPMLTADKYSDLYRERELQKDTYRDQTSMLTSNKYYDSDMRRERDLPKDTYKDERSTFTADKYSDRDIGRERDLPKDTYKDERTNFIADKFSDRDMRIERDLPKDTYKDERSTFIADKYSDRDMRRERDLPKDTYKDERSTFTADKYSDRDIRRERDSPKDIYKDERSTFNADKYSDRDMRRERDLPKDTYKDERSSFIADKYSDREIRRERDLPKNPYKDERSLFIADKYSDREIRRERDLPKNPYKDERSTFIADKYSDREIRREKDLPKRMQRKDRSRSPISKNSSATLEQKIEKKRILPKVKNSLLKGQFSKQVKELLAEVNSDVCKSVKVNDICKDVEKALNYELKGTMVKPYGCLNAGIGIKGGSLELCVYFPDDVKLKLLRKKSLCLKYLDIIRDILKQHSTQFRNVALNPEKTSVCFVHTSSKYEVIIGVLRDAMVLNDNLFDIYLSSDERLVPVFVFILFWAYSHGLIDGSSFDEHEMVLLIIFYLQRLEKPILPPAYMLQYDEGGRHIDDKCLSYWHTMFVVNSETFPRNENDSDLLSLIEGFYLFYSDFSFKNIVISLFSGLTIPSQVFLENVDLPEEFKKYIYLVKNKFIYPLNTESPICIQDPIKLNRNATTTITSKQLDYFKEKCLAASGLMYKFRMKHTEVGLASALLNLTDNTIDQVHKISSEICTRYGGKLKEDDAILILGRLTNLLNDIFTNILKAKYSVNKHVNYCKKKHMTHTDIVYLCTQYYNLWSSRTTYKSRIPHYSSMLEWEAALSNKLVESVYQNLPCKSPMFEFTVKGHVKQEEKIIYIELIFKDVEEDSISGLISFIAPIIDYELKRICIV